MEISEQALFKKMEQELLAAKTAVDPNDKARHLHGLAVLIEVMEGSSGTGYSDALLIEKMTGETPSPSLNNEAGLSGKKIDMDDGANGNSLLDF